VLEGSAPALPRPFLDGSSARTLGVGLLLAAVLTLAPPLRFMGWLLGSLFHETGHVAFAWFVACPAFPAIDLRGHAAAFHREQSLPVALAIGALLAYGAWAAASRPRLRWLAWGALAAWPLFAFVRPLREVGFLMAGHGGELAFAAVFLWRARTGEAVERAGERPLYACLAWFLVGRNVVLSFGLAFLPAARAAYATNGSYGLENDYTRVAGQWLNLPVSAVAFAMLVASLAVAPTVLWFVHRRTD
jgi:hypothetical protein